MRSEYYHAHPGAEVIHLPPRNAYHLPRLIGLRLAYSLVSGKYTQNHQPVGEQTEPVGHAVRFVYLQTARAMLAAENESHPELGQMQKLWEHMITRRMYASGGLGALPLVEGFGRDYELPSAGAYAETCAAIGSIFLNHELGLLTGWAAYDDLLEWQLYNSASVGAGLDGCSYLYNNPLENHGEIERAGWYDCPCCPSNLSRMWLNLGHYAISSEAGLVRIRQFISARWRLSLPEPVEIEMTSGMPWNGRNRLTIHCASPIKFRLEFRLPSWAEDCRCTVSGEAITLEKSKGMTEMDATACGYDPRRAGWVSIEREWKDGDFIELDFGMRISLYPQDKRIRGYGGQYAIGYGPLLYCRENIEDTQAKSEPLRLGSFKTQFEADILGGATILIGMTQSGQPVELIPYLLWGNRGSSALQVFFEGSQEEVG